MAKIYSTPGVYIEEKSTFPNSIVPLKTAVPCFIGFTEKAIRGQKTLHDQLVRIESFDEFSQVFGSAPSIKYSVVVDATNPASIAIDPIKTTQFYLYYSLKLYFANGGAECYIYSVGKYSDRGATGLSKEKVSEALKALLKESEPTLIVIPDGHTMNLEDYYSLWSPVLRNCKDMINRFAIVDIYGGGVKANVANQVETNKLLDAFRAGIGTENLNFGAAYWPWLQTTVVNSNELDFRNIEKIETTVIPQLRKEAAAIYGNQQGQLNERGEEMKAIINRLMDLSKPPLDGSPNISESIITQTNNALLQVSPLYKAIMHGIHETANMLPPSGAMAGIYKSVDEIGIHRSPANIAVSAVSRPIVEITSAEQETLNVPLDGKSINAIRSFPGRGILVWGARTMDGNSLDWRYISVRRTVSMIELSIKNGVKAFIFEPNTDRTWSNLKAMITDFLTGMFKEAVLVGTTPSSAFSVDIGLGTTMTPTDILNGYMRISVSIAVVHPAEFIVLTFEQEMQKS